MKKYVVIGVAVVLLILSCISGVLIHSQDSINILILGIDKYEGMSVRKPLLNSQGTTIGQADAIFVASIDRDNNMQITSVLRDTIVPLEMYDSDGNYLGQQEGQITLQYAYGDGEELSCNLMQEQVEEILNIDIDAVVSINRSAFIYINDLVGGVEVNVDEYTDQLIPELDHTGETTLLGEAAMCYCFARDLSNMEGSAIRVSRMKQYMQSFLPKAKDLFKKDPSIVLRVYNELQDNYYVTGLDFTDIFNIISRIADCHLVDSFQTLDGTYDTSSDYVEFHSSGNLKALE